MQGKIGLEEHFSLQDTLSHSSGFVGPETWKILSRHLVDFQGERIEQMDQTGIERMLLSLNAPALQAITDRAQAAEIMRRTNDVLAEEVARRPNRFSGLAALAMHDPDVAARELERCVKELGFRGALVNGYTQDGDT